MSANRLFLCNLFLIAGVFASGSTQAACPDWLNHEFHELRSGDTFNICGTYGEKPILVVDPASEQVWHFPSHVRPGDAGLTEQIEAVL